VEVTASAVVVEVDGEIFSLAFETIDRARLVPRF
jgi:hypothetical protein